MSDSTIVFDFDGVVCDSNDECQVVSWNAWREINGEPGDVTDVQEFTAAELSRFRSLRGYVRGAAEYYVVHRSAAEGIDIGSQRQFEQLSVEWAEGLAGYKMVFYAARERLRGTNPEAWLSLHRMYPQVVEVVAGAHRRGCLYVATLKDKESVLRLLKSQGIELAEDRVYDQAEIHDKLDALRRIAEREGVGLARLTFIDDNVFHLLPPLEAGVACYLAEWGYHTAEHLDVASRYGLPRVGLDQLHMLLA